MKYVVSYSGGLGSASATKRLIENGVPIEDIELVFCDTLIEDDDLYRFINDTTRRLQLPFTHLKDGRHPWEVFKDEKYQGNSRTAHCSDKLKTEMFKKYIEEKYNWDCVVVLGMDFQEDDRIERAKEKYPCKVIAPMAAKPWKSRLEVEKEWENMGIAIPRLYGYGFAHNNCGGFCVRAGLKQFRNLYKTFPDRYLWHENEQEKYIKWFMEYKTTQHAFHEIDDEDYKKAIESKGHPFLRKTINGKLEYITLKEFREKYMNDLTPDPDCDYSVGCGCFIQ